jgi:uncharacterized membrane protein YecN with MAPEG domain
MRITGLYAAIATLLIVILAMRVTLRRRAIGVGIGNGGDAVLARRVRAHANAAEYLPLALLLLLILELDQTQPMLLHVFGCLLIVARVLHAFGLVRSLARTRHRHRADLVHARGDGVAAALADTRYVDPDLIELNASVRPASCRRIAFRRAR